ncbi:MAG: hypothetical protein IID14_08295 [Candidatus Marinimicrobia bacterium]|nr:hypothetical protein [Candidatus Neomarinimicrobiota bacterium]
MAIVFDAGGVGAKDKPVLTVPVGIENDLKGIGFVERSVTAAVGNDDAAGVLIEADDTEIEGVGRIEYANLGTLGYGLAFIRGILP